MSGMWVQCGSTPSSGLMVKIKNKVILRKYSAVMCFLYKLLQGHTDTLSDTPCCLEGTTAGQNKHLTRSLMFLTLTF